MAADTRIEDVKTLLDAINADDVAEDAAFQATIDGLSTSLATVTAERDTANASLATVTAERAALATEKATTIAFLVAQRDSLDARITALGG